MSGAPLDLRAPLGALFLVLGSLLAAFGAASDPALYRASLGINVNLWWGGALALFGAAMLVAARRRRPPTGGQRLPTRGRRSPTRSPPAPRTRS